MSRNTKSERTGVWKKGISEILFSFSGRINRTRFWLFEVILLTFLALSVVLGAKLGGDDGMAIGIIIGELIILWPLLAINVKRCHDRDRSGTFMLLLFIPLLNIWYAIEIFYLRGTVGDNQYGPDPLSTKSDNQYSSGPVSYGATSLQQQGAAGSAGELYGKDKLKASEDTIDFFNNSPKVCIICTSLQTSNVDADWILKNLAVIVGTIAGLKNIQEVYELLDKMKTGGFRYHVLAGVTESDIISGSIGTHAREYKEYIKTSMRTKLSQPKIIVTDDILGRSRSLGFCFYY